MDIQDQKRSLSDILSKNHQELALGSLGRRARYHEMAHCCFFFIYNGICWSNFKQLVVGSENCDQ